MSLKFWIPTLFIIVVFGVTIPAMVIGDNSEDTGGGGGGSAATSETDSGSGGGAGASEAPAGTGAAGATAAAGKQIFTQSCGTCHTLSDAGTAGRVGPVLDEIKPEEAQVLAAIKKGGLGSGSMPANIVSGKDAQDVAAYVSSVAGQ